MTNTMTPIQTSKRGRYVHQPWSWNPKTLLNNWNDFRAGLRQQPQRAFVSGEFKDGDILLCHGRYLISQVSEFITGGPYSHAAIVMIWQGDPMLLQAGLFGIQATPLEVTVKKYNGLVDWYRPTVGFMAGVNCSKLGQEARKDLGLGFALLTAVRQILYRTFGWFKGHDEEHPQALFRSQFVARCFAAAGASIADNKDPIDTLPGDIAFSRNVCFKDRLPSI